MKKLFNNWSDWAAAFIFATLLIVMFKVLSNVDAIGSMISNFMRIISPFLFGILIVYFLYVPCVKIERLYAKSKIKFLAKKNRFFGVMTTYLLLLLITGLFINFLVPILIANIVALINNIPVFINQILTWLNTLPEDSFLNGLNVTETLNNFSSEIVGTLFTSAQIEQYARGIMSIGGTLFNLVVSLITSLYILLDRENIAKFFNRAAKSLLNPSTNTKVKKYLRQVNDVLFAFISAKGLNSLINGVVVTTILLVLGVEYAFLLGFLAAIGNFIPYLGTLIAVTVIAFITFLTGGLGQAIIVLIPLLIFQQLDGNVIEPKIMSKNLKISPLLVIFSVVVGGAYFGIIGMFLAVPIATIFKQLLLEYISSKEAKALKTKKA